MVDSEKKIKWVSSGNYFLVLFCKGPPFQNNGKKIIQILQFIHQSKALVELIRNMLFLKKLLDSDFWPKTPKNSDLIMNIIILKYNTFI
jgi:hypothetical protein